MTARELHPGERAARHARRRLGVADTGPVDDILVRCERNAGIPVLLDRFQTQEIAGAFLRSPRGEMFIAVNADPHPVRQRFTLVGDRVDQTLASVCGQVMPEFAGHCQQLLLSPCTDHPAALQPVARRGNRKTEDLCQACDEGRLSCVRDHLLFLEPQHRMGYPRVPQATLAYARRAYDEGLIEDEEYVAIVGEAPADADLDGWLE